VLVAIGSNGAGKRSVLARARASRESVSSGKERLTSLRDRSLPGVEFVVSDNQAGWRRAIQEVLPPARGPRCYVPFLRHAWDYRPRQADDDCRQELRCWIYHRREAQEARQDWAAWLRKGGQRYPKLGTWVEEKSEERLSF